MYAQANVLDLISRIYDSASNPQLWNMFLEELNTSMRNVAATLHVHDFSNQSGRLLAEVGLDTSFNQKYNEYYSQRNILMARGSQLLVEGNIVSSEQICSDSEFTHTEYYNDYLLPQKIFYLAGGTIFRRSDFAAIISAARPRSRPFNAEDQRLFKVLMPHLQRALQFHKQLEAVQFDRDTAVHALNMLRFAFIVVTAQAKIMLTNRAADKLLAKSNGLKSDHGVLRAERSRDGGVLRQMIAQVACTSSGEGMHPGGILSLMRSGLRAPLSVLVCPVRLHDITALSLSDRPAAVLLINDPEVQPAPGQQALRQLFGLTNAEARLTMLLLEGYSPKNAAERLKVTHNTVHTQLNSVFAKTGANRQSDLMRILLTGLPQLDIYPNRIQSRLVAA